MAGAPIAGDQTSMTAAQTRSLRYHLMELDIATNREDARRILPTVLDTDRAILDIGCGIGQSFLALDCGGRRCVGIDVDADAVAYGQAHYRNLLHYIVSDAAYLPLQSEAFDLVFSRVSLPYTNIPRVLREIHRVLKPGGRVWVTVHARSRTLGHMRRAMKFPLKVRKIVYGTYVLLNGYLLKHFGVVVPFVNGRYESWQDVAAMKRLLLQYGFEVQEFTTAVHVGFEAVRKT